MTVDRDLTDEQLVALFDADQDALVARANAEFTEAVEAVRAGTIFARDRAAHDRWQRDMERSSGQRPTGKSLAQLARDLGVSGGAVVMGEFEFRGAA